MAEGIEDYRDRELRKMNLILHNLPESEALVAKDRTEADVSSFSSICEEVLQVEGCEVESCCRLGKRVEGKNRLVKVTVKSVSMKRSVLQEARKLRQSEDAILKKVYITPDLSVKDREVQKKLQKELRERRDNGEENLVIRRGQIVSRSEPFRAGPQ